MSLNFKSVIKNKTIEIQNIAEEINKKLLKPAHFKRLTNPRFQKIKERYRDSGASISLVRHSAKYLSLTRSPFLRSFYLKDYEQRFPPRKNVNFVVIYLITCVR